MQESQQYALDEITRQLSDMMKRDQDASTSRNKSGYHVSGDDPSHHEDSSESEGSEDESGKGEGSDRSDTSGGSESSSFSSSDESDNDPFTPKDRLPDMSPFEGSDITLRWYRTAMKMKKKYKKSKKKSKKRRTEKLFRYLMKSADDYHLPSLNYHPVPPKRRHGFNVFMDKLKLVTSTVRETKKLLADVANPKEPKSPSANKALFRLLCAKSDAYTTSQLIDYQQRMGESGFDALLLLRSIFAATDDPAYRKQTLNRFTTIALNPGESVYQFNKRFTHLYRLVVGSGQHVEEEDRTGIYLHCMKEYRDPAILYEVKALMRRYEKNPAFKSLVNVQNKLLKEYEDSMKLKAGDTTESTERGRRPNGGMRSNRQERRKTTANNVKKKPKQSPNVRCYGCKQLGHILSDCKTTSDKDKKRLYELNRHSRSQSQGYSHNQELNNPLTQRIAAKATNTKMKSTQKSTSVAKEGPREGKAASSAAASAMRRTAICSMAKKDIPDDESLEGSVPDPLDVAPPMIDGEQAVINPSVKIVVYEDDVLIDSGASDSMAPSFKYLDLIETSYATVLLADGAVHNSDYQGVMRIQVTDVNTAEKFIIPVTQTLLVPGLRVILWAVAPLADQGHYVTFGFSTVSITMHAGTEKEFTIGLRHPLLTNNGNMQAKLPFAAPTVRRHGDHHTPMREDYDESEDDEDNDEEIPHLIPRAMSDDSDSDDEDDLPPLIRPRVLFSDSEDDESTVEDQDVSGDDEEFIPTDNPQTNPIESILPDYGANHNFQAYPVFIEDDGQDRMISSPPLHLRPKRPVMGHIDPMDDRWLKDKTIDEYRRKMGKYITDLAQYQKEYGLFQGELPVYQEQSFPRVEHDKIDHSPRKPTLSKGYQNLTPLERREYDYLKQLYDKAMQFWQEWDQKDQELTQHLAKYGANFNRAELKQDTQQYIRTLPQGYLSGPQYAA
jgi:hypothetical protein